MKYTHKNPNLSNVNLPRLALTFDFQTQASPLDQVKYTCTLQTLKATLSQLSKPM